MPRTCDRERQANELPCPMDPYVILPEKCKYVDMQTWKLQESPEQVQILLLRSLYYFLRNITSQTRTRLITSCNFLLCPGPDGRDAALDDADRRPPPRRPRKPGRPRHRHRCLLILFVVIFLVVHAAGPPSQVSQIVYSRFVFLGPPRVP